MYNEQTGTMTKSRAKRSVIQWILVLGAILAAVLAITTYVLEPVVPEQYLLYVQVGEVVVIGYFIIHVFSVISYRLALAHSTVTANSIKSLVRIAGAIIVVAVVVSYLSQDPVIAASLAIISGLIIGFASSNLIGNVIAGAYLAIARPFRIGDNITVFGQTGKITDINLLYTRLILDESQNEMLAPNTSLVTTWLVLIRNKQETARTSEVA